MLSRIWNPLFSSSLKSSSTLFSRGFVLTTLSRARYGFKSSNFAQQFQGRTVVGPTLRERLLGPTSGKPFIYGTYALAGASVVGIGLLGYYGLGLGEGLSAMDKRAMWPDYVRQRIHSTYAYLAGSLAVTAGSGVLASRSRLIMSIVGRGGLLTFFATLAAIVGTGMVVRAISYDDNSLAKHAAWLVHVGVMGAVLAPMCFIGGPALLRAAWYTAGLVAGLSAVAVCAPSEKFLNMAGPLAMGLGVVFVSCVGSFFFPAHTALGAGLASIVVYGGLILFSMFLLYDTQRIIKAAESSPRHGFYGQQQPTDYYGQSTLAGQYTGMHAGKFDPINAQLSLYMDILNIFIRMAMIFGGGGQRRK